MTYDELASALAAALTEIVEQKQYEGFGDPANRAAYQRTVALAALDLAKEQARPINPEAAPDLLKALRAIRDYCFGGDIPQELIDAADAAIDKAEGR